MPPNHFGSDKSRVTTNEPGTWVRVSRSAPCPVCGKPDWCVVAEDGSACICPRVESAKRAGDGGWLHVIRDRSTPPTRPAPKIRAPQPEPDLTELAVRFQCAAVVNRISYFARHIDVSTNSMIAFGVGWSAEDRAWSFPMRNPVTGRVVGIRLRRDTGAKFSVRGGREGLFMPDDFDPAGAPLVIAEGATDALAAHTIGFRSVVGRPSCSGGCRHLAALARLRQPARIVILSDADEPGRCGAAELAEQLSLFSRDVRVAEPPRGHKDLRAWVGAGATRDDVELWAARGERLVATVKGGGA